MTILENNRWIAADDEFATRIEIPDVQGFFSKSVVVEPGFRALFLENGKSLGEFPPGRHTLANLIDRMKFWTQKTATVIVARQQDVRLEMTCPRLMTSEFLEVEIALALSVQIDDVAMFFTNLMGSKTSISVSDIRQIVEPLLSQSLTEAVSRLSIKELVAEYKRADIESGVARALQTSLLRYGLKFGAVQTLTMAHPEYDAQRQRSGQMWLQRQELDFDKQAAALAADRLFAQIEQKEKADDLDILQQQVAADHMEAELVVRMRRIGLRKQIRAAALAGQFDRLNSEEELMTFLEQRDRERLIRKDEIDALKATLGDQLADRQSARQHLLTRLDLEQSAELESVRIDLDHARRLKLRQHEIALADLNQTEDSKKWKAGLQREVEESEQRRAQAQQQLEHDLKLGRDSSTARRQDEFDGAMARQRVHRIEIEMQVDAELAVQRIAALQLESKNAQESAALEMERRKAALIEEAECRAGEDQIKRLQLVTEINVATQRANHQMLLEAERQKAELEVMKNEAVARAATAKITALRGASAFEIMAAAPDVAAPIADVMKTEFSANATVATANAHTTATHAASQRERELHSQVVDAKKEGMDAAIAAYKDFLQSQQTSHQTTMQQFGTTIENVTKNISPQGPQVILAGGPSTSLVPPTSVSPAQTSNRVVMCPGCRAENHEIDRHCRQCGKAL